MKKIAAIHDLSGYGRASLTVAIPILSYMGYQVCPLPTAILSAHSEYKDFRSFDLTDQMQGIIDHWKELDLHFDALYSGYLASEKQMNIVSGFFDDFSQDDNFILVDPVLGDHGKLYPGMDTGMITGMRELCKKANVITPNLTEAAFLLDTAPSPHTPPAEAIEWCKALSKLGPEYVIITSAPSGNEKKFMIICCISTIFNIIANAFIIPLFGANGAAAITLQPVIRVPVMLLQVSSPVVCSTATVYLKRSNGLYTSSTWESRLLSGIPTIL